MMALFRGFTVMHAWNLYVKIDDETKVYGLFFEFKPSVNEYETYKSTNFEQTVVVAIFSYALSV